MGPDRLLLPSAAGPGRPWREHRQVVNGILWRLETGSTWREIPKCYDPWQTCYERWTEDGTWARVLAESQTKEAPLPQSITQPPINPHTPKPSKRLKSHQTTPQIRDNCT
ncbi:transposase [Nonomuraea sp. NPDC001684]